jgi:CHRD domain-containing protein
LAKGRGACFNLSEGWLAPHEPPRFTVTREAAMNKPLLILLVLGSLLLAGTSSAASFVAAPLAGSNEVPANDSKGRGAATFGLSGDETLIDYRLVVANIRNVTMSHIHLAPAGQNGPIVAFLYGPVGPGGGRTDGVLATGTLTAASLVGPLAGQPLSALIAAMRAGNTYVNVHTNDGVDPPNTGPGDIPGGEIRAQIRVAD